MAKTEKHDRRTRRTERNLREALISLILEKGYDRVTVQDIIDRADVGRSTFYAHFESKDKLHLSAFDHVRDVLLHSGETGDDSSEISGDFNFNSLRLFQHAHENRRIYRALAGKASGDLFLKNMFRQMHDLFLQELQNSLPENRKDSVETKAAAHFYVSSLVSLLTFWLDNNLPLSPEEMNELFRSLAMRGLEKLQQSNS
ncbi:MAG: TetR/AcrR family transcriptional regulator [Acidobacteriota bacterium]|nr:TetR/AcrR family transcriptional regulator [Acidobacteriota bacterium]